MNRWRYCPYECPRCGYTTEKKSCMRTHLYARANVCFNFYDVELKDDVKEHVLNNRIFNKPPEPDLPDIHVNAPDAFH